MGKATQYRCRTGFSFLRGKDGEESFTLAPGTVLSEERCRELGLRSDQVEPIEEGVPFVPPDESETE